MSSVGSPLPPPPTFNQSRARLWGDIRSVSGVLPIPLDAAVCREGGLGLDLVPQQLRGPDPRLTGGNLSPLICLPHKIPSLTKAKDFVFLSLCILFGEPYISVDLTHGSPVDPRPTQLASSLIAMYHDPRPTDGNHPPLIRIPHIQPLVPKTRGLFSSPFAFCMANDICPICNLHRDLNPLFQPFTNSSLSVYIIITFCARGRESENPYFGLYRWL